MSAAVGTAIVGLVSTVVGVVGDKTKAESEAEIDAWMNQNKDLMASNRLPLIIIGSMFSIAIVASVIKRKK